MCVKPADRTTHSPPKTFARPRTATRPSRALPLPHAAPPHARRLRDARPADRTPHSPPKTFARPAQRHALPEHFRSPTQHRRTPAGCAMHARRPHNPFPPKTFAHPRTATRPRRALPLPHAAPTHVHAAPTHARRLCDAFPAALTTHSPPKTFARPRTATRPSRALPLPHAAPTHARRLRDARPPTAQPITRSATLPLLPFRFGHKKTAPHSGCAMPNVSVDRRCGRSLGLVSRALFAAVAGRWRVGVGLRPQPWALRSRRCGRVLRA